MYNLNTANKKWYDVATRYYNEENTWKKSYGREGDFIYRS